LDGLVDVAVADVVGPRWNLRADEVEEPGIRL
jgi:hypothetical protein